MMDREHAAFEELVSVCRRLRGPDGCPWDREQTLESMTPYLTEEAAETGDAIANSDAEGTAEELGDLLFLSVFCLELLAERSGIGLAESMERASQKLIRRHPHVYGGAAVADGGAAYAQWQEIKQREKGSKGSLLGDQPKGMPALISAYRLQEKAAAVGFDWPNSKGALDKVREEFAEIEDALEHRDSAAVAGEIGDLLFAVVNVSRKLSVDPERELRATAGRFRDRFRHIESRLAEQGKRPAESTLDEMDALWNEAKARTAAAESPKDTR